MDHTFFAIGTTHNRPPSIFNNTADFRIEVCGKNKDGAIY